MVLNIRVGFLHAQAEGIYRDSFPLSGLDGGGVGVGGEVWVGVNVGVIVRVGVRVRVGVVAGGLLPHALKI